MKVGNPGTRLGQKVEARGGTGSIEIVGPVGVVGGIEEFVVRVGIVAQRRELGGRDLGVGIWAFENFVDGGIRTARTDGGIGATGTGGTIRRWSLRGASELAVAVVVRAMSDAELDNWSRS